MTAPIANTNQLFTEALLGQLMPESRAAVRIHQHHPREASPPRKASLLRPHLNQVSSTLVADTERDTAGIDLSDSQVDRQPVVGRHTEPAQTEETEASPSPTAVSPEVASESLLCTCSLCRHSHVSSNHTPNHADTLGSVQPQPLNQPTATSSSVRALQSGYKWDSNTITYSFYDSETFKGNYYGTETQVRELSDATKTNIRSILSWLETAVNVDFVEVNEQTGNVGQIRYMASSGPSYAYAYYPLSNALQISGDVHFNPIYDTANGDAGLQSTPGSYGYMTLIHETLHALGLKHPFDDSPNLPASEDNTSNTIMSYTTTGASAATPMVLDLQALHELYGANPNAAQATQYSFQQASSFSTNGQQNLPPNTQVKSILWDSGGNDILDFSDATLVEGGYRIDLREGGWISTNEAFKGNYVQSGTSIAAGTTIETLLNSSSDDLIWANGAANTFGGYSLGIPTGDDVLHLAEANDTLDLSDFASWQVGQSQVGNDLQLNLGGISSLAIRNYFTGNAPLIQFSNTSQQPPAKPLTPASSTARSTVTNQSSGAIAVSGNALTPRQQADPLTGTRADQWQVGTTDLDSPPLVDPLMVGVESPSTQTQDSPTDNDLTELSWGAASSTVPQHSCGSLVAGASGTTELDSLWTRSHPSVHTDFTV